MKVTKKILGLFVIGCTAVASFTNATLINNGNELWLELDTNETGNFDNTWFNLGVENSFDIKNEGNGNWNFWYGGDNYTNIRRTNTNNGGQYFGTQRYIFWNNGNITITTSNVQGNYRTAQCPKRKKLDYNGYQNISNFNDTGFTYTVDDIKNEITTIDKEIFGSISVQGAYEMVTDVSRTVYCIKSQQSVYCNVSTPGERRQTPYCYGGAVPIDLGLQNVMTITDIEQNNLNEASPFIGGGNSSGTGEETTGQLYCPPIKHEITMYGYKYNTGLCYSNTEEISGGQVITVTPISIFDAFPTYQAYAQAYSLVTNNCHTSTVNTVEQCQTALQTIGKKPSQILLKLINSEIQEGVSLSKIYQYCHLQLDFTEEEKRNLSTCDLKEEETYYATGVNGNTNSNPNPLEGYTDILQETDTILTPEDGSIFDAILPDGVLTWKDVIFNANFMSHFATLYTKITLMFRARPYQDGILPPVITSLLLLIILFKVYKK